MDIFDVVDSQINYSNTNLVIFDVDGTLYEQNKLRMYMLIHMLIYFLKNPSEIIELKIVREFRNQREYKNHDITINLKEEEYNGVANKFGVDYYFVENTINKWLLKEPLNFILKCKKIGVDKLFRKLTEKNIKIAIFSDYPAEEKIKCLNLHVDLIVSSTDEFISVLKPNPKGLIFILNYFSISINECVYIGDRWDKDGECAKNAGISTFIKV